MHIGNCPFVLTTAGHKILQTTIRNFFEGQTFKDLVFRFFIERYGLSNTAVGIFCLQMERTILAGKV